ncbi:Uncharacterised protein [Streptococcus infantis]|nr:HNH endonuclease [Streptococcus infantis]SUN82514.1 Uncharacterised protein [Streptococcus infantis]
MTKDVELHSSTWKSMKQAITGLTENVTVSSSGYGNYTNAQAGPYSTGTTSTGFAKRVEDLVKISEKVQQMIKERDTDGVVSYTYHDETSTAQTLQSKLSTLERYAENVNNYIKNKIDQPFYEAMDKVGAKLEALSIQQYKTTNKVGYKRIEPVKDPYGHPVGTKEVTPREIGIDELYKVDSPYKATLQKSYEEFKKSKDYKDHKLTQDQYLMAMHHTRSFEYVSIDDEKANIEMWRDIALGVGVVVLTIFCPPAGAVASVVVASADMYSAASGKDWGTGRELDNTERGMRGAFALFDLIPAGKYLSGLAKTGKTAGLTAVKTSLKTGIKEGVEQGIKNLDNLKGILKSTKGLTDNMISQLKTYGKQLDNLRPSKILSNSADALSDGLRHADNVLSEAAQRFSLNPLKQLQPATGSIPFEGGKLTHIADNISAFAKNLDGSVDDVMEAGSKVSKDSDGKIFGRLELANKSHSKTGIKFDQEGFPIFDSFGDMYLEPEDYLKSRGTHFDRASKDLYQQIMANDELARKFTQEEIELFKNGSVPKRFTWHHHQNPGLMQLVDRRIHRQTGHIGGYSIWGKGN